MTQQMVRVEMTIPAVVFDQWKTQAQRAAGLHALGLIPQKAEGPRWRIDYDGDGYIVEFTVPVLIEEARNA